MAKKIQRSSMTQTDDKGRVLRAPRDNSSPDKQSFQWWKLEDPQMIANAIAATVKFIGTHQSSRLEQLTISTRLYGNSTAYNLLGTAFNRSASVNSNPMSQRLSFNLISSVADTLTAKMAKNKVIPTFVTNGGVWKYQKKAKDLTKFAQGLAYQLHLHDMCIDGFRDGAVWGDGFTHVFERNGKVAIERVLPHELFVDIVESMCEEPRQLHRVKIVDRDVACDMFPELEEAIYNCSPANYQQLGAQGTAADLITITESWHLRSGEDCDDGCRVISIGDSALVYEWDKDYFPFPHFRYSKKMLGWYSQGAAERLQTLQGEINRSMILEQKSRWMQGSFKVLIENGSKVVAQHLNNEVGTLVYYTGVAPQYVTPPAIDGSNREWIDSLIVKGYKQEGVSELSSSGEVPQQVSSGKAMRTKTQIEDDRFTFVSQQMEEYVLENIRQAIDVVKDIYKDKKSYEVVFPATNFLETVDWHDINLEADAYVLKAYPTSSLADDVSGRLSDIQELMQAGLISPRTGQRLMNMPDIEMNENLSNASEDLLHKVLEKMIFDEEYKAPEPFWDLQLAEQLVLEYYNYAEYMNAPESVLALLQQFNAQLKDMTGVVQQAQQQQAMIQQMQAQQQGAGVPQANPAAPPTSNLIQNVPGVQ
jgi:hypothetical protein